MSDPRRFYRCTECRRRKQKCLPISRRWDDRVKEPCDHCRKKHLHCGPNINSAGDEEVYHESTHHARNSRHRAECNNRHMYFGMQPQASSPARTGLSFPISPQFSPPAPPPTLQMPAASSRGFSPPQPRRTSVHSSASIPPSWAQVASRQHSVAPTAEARLSELDAMVEIHSWLRILDRSLCRYRSAGRRRSGTSLSDKENGIANFICRMLDLFPDQVGNALTAIDQRVPTGRNDLLRQLQDTVDRFLSDVGSTNVNPRLVHICNGIADRLAPEYSRHSNHIQAYRVRRLSFASSCNGGRRLSTDPGRIVHDNEIEQFLASFNQVHNKLQEILHYYLHSSYALCFGSAQQPCLSAGHYAFLSGNPSVAYALYDCGKWTLSDVDFLGRGPAHLAAEWGDLRLLQLIDAKDPEAIRRTLPDFYRLSLLSLAAMNGHLEVFKFLLDRSAEIWVRDLDGKNALYFAASQGHLLIVEHQLSASYNAQDPRRLCSPLHAAAAAGHQQVVVALVEAGADPRPPFDGITAASLAAKGKHQKTERYLRAAEKSWNEREIGLPLQDQVRDSSLQVGRAGVQPRPIQLGILPQSHDNGTSTSNFIDPTVLGTTSPSCGDPNNTATDFTSFSEDSMFDYSDSSFANSINGRF